MAAFDTDNCLKMVNFDISSTVLKDIGLPRWRAYSALKKSLLHMGFRWRQNSCYVSIETMSDIECLKAINQLRLKNPWLSQAAQRFDITNIAGEDFSAMHIIQGESAKANDPFIRSKEALLGKKVISKIGSESWLTDKNRATAEKAAKTDTPNGIVQQDAPTKPQIKTALPLNTKPPKVPHGGGNGGNSL
jgi:virulence-associated protein VapD